MQQTEEELLKRLSDEDFITYNEAAHWFTIAKKGVVDFRTCVNCQYSKCPYVLSAIIINYILNNELEQKFRERKEYRKNVFRSNYFEFKWEAEKGLSDIPDDSYNLCKKMVDNDFIKVMPKLDDSGLLSIYYIPVSCYEYDLLKRDFSKLEIKDSFYNKNTWRCLKRSNKEILKYCKDYKCNYSACIFSVAGYIYYLKKMGLYDKINEDREYYKAHKIEIDLEINKQKQEAINSQKQKKEEKIKEFSHYSNRIKNIDSLINSITSLNQNQFHMTLEGNDIKTIEECSNIIKEVFNNLEYTSSFLKISLQNLASTIVTDHTSNNNLFFYKWIYNSLASDKLYIINGIREFVEDYKLYQNYANSAYKELRLKQFNHTLELLSNMNNFIILEGTQDEINDLFELNNGLKFVFQQNRYIVLETSIDEMYQIFLKALNPNLRKICTEDNSIKNSFIDFIAFNKEYMPFSNTEISNYLASYCNINNEIKFPDNVYKKETVDESLSAIIGMDTIKEKVKEFEKYVMFNIKAKTLGLELANSNLHMIFTGNPGTGKTTIARIMAKMLYDLGLIKENKLIEVERKDLVAGYIGQTAIKTAEVIEKARGGVLFIDEAYSLAQKNVGNDFGKEAIATLIKAMEDHKGEFVVIFAGYSKEMKEFVDVNPGIASRIGYIFEFEDYSREELCEIYYKKINESGLTINEDAKPLVFDLMNYFHKVDNIGNGRFVDRVIQETIMKHAKNKKKNC